MRYKIYYLEMESSSPKVLQSDIFQSEVERILESYIPSIIPAETLIYRSIYSNPYNQIPLSTIKDDLDTLLSPKDKEDRIPTGYELVLGLVLETNKQLTDEMFRSLDNVMRSLQMRRIR